MKNPTDPRGRVFKIKGRSAWTDETKRDLWHLDDIPSLPSRAVLVIGKSEDKKGYWKVAFIMAERDLTVDTDLQLPIRPARKDKKTGIQLIFCDDYDLGCKPGWVNLLRIMELPRSILEGISELHLQLKSYNRVRSFMKERSMSPGL